MKTAYPIPMISLISGLKSIQLARAGRIRDVSTVRGIVMIGSSCAGKSVVVDAVRNSCKLADDGVEVPTRYITRPKRHGDNTTENRYVSTAEFEQLVATGHIGINWIRKMEGNREERYGFGKTTRGMLPIISGNNAFFDNPKSVQPAGLGDEVLIIGVYAPDSVRKQRLLSRSPDLVHQRPAEVAYRLGDSSENIINQADCLIHNYGAREALGIREVVEFIGRLLAAIRMAE